MRTFTFLTLPILVTIAVFISGAFCNFSKNGYLNMAHSSLKYIPKDLDSRTVILNLSFNEISNISNGIFQNMTNLVQLDLSHNLISGIHLESFKSLGNLRYLNLSYNQLNSQMIADGSFKCLSSLFELLVHGNVYTDLRYIVNSGEIFTLKSLNYLYIDSCEFLLSQLYRFKTLKNLKGFHIMYLKNIMIKNTTFRDLSEIPLEELTLPVISIEMKAFQYFPLLHSLDINLGWNLDNIDGIFQSLDIFKDRNMTRLSLADNPSYSPLIMQKKHFKYLWQICSKELYLRNMQIYQMEARSFLMFAAKSKCLEVLDMSYNPIQNSRNFLPFAFHYFKKIRIMRCFQRGRNIRKKRSTTKKVLSFEIAIPKTLEEFSVTHILIFDKGLPNITTKNGNSLKILNIAYSDVSDCLGLFQGIQNLLTLDISGFNCEKINEKLLSKLTSLTMFIAKESGLGIGFKRNPKSSFFFRGLFNLTFVDISSSYIDELPEFIFYDQRKSLEYINLANNSMQRIPFDFLTYPHLKLLDLRWNNIIKLSETDQDIIRRNGNVEVLLSGNPFLCTCKEIKFLRWILNYGMKLFEGIHCTGDHNIRHNITNIARSVNKFEKKCVSPFWLPFAVTLSSLFVLVLILSVIYYRYRYPIEYLFLRIKMKLSQYKQIKDTTSYEFDAFISYCSLDREWMVPFQRKVTSMGFRLCFDVKDFIAGDPIAENILRAINNSRKVIFVLSKNFLESKWGDYELEMTRMHAFRNGRENMVIIIMKENIRMQKMPKVLKNIWYRITCIKYFDQDEELFYKSVTTALSVQ